MPIKMTRAEYEAKYGTPVPQASTPIKMTRAEYETKYGLGANESKPNIFQGLVQSVANPFLRVGVNAENIINAATGKPQIEQKDFGYFGSAKRIPGPFDTANPQEAIGVGLDLGSNLIGTEGLGGVAKAGLKGAILQGVKTGVISGTASGALSGAGQSLEQGKSLKETGLNTGIGSIGGLVFGGISGALSPLLGNGLIKTAAEAERVKGVLLPPTEDLIEREKNNLKNALEDAFKEKATLRRKSEIAEKYGENPAETFARFGAVPKVIDGKMDTTDIVNHFDDAIKSRVDARKPVLQQLSEIAPNVTSTSADSFENKVLNKIANDADAKKTGLVSKYQAIVKDRFNDYRSSYGDRFSLPIIDDIRSGQAKLTKAYNNDQFQSDASEYIRKVAGDLLESKTDNTTLGDVNKEIRDLINAKDIAKAMNGTPIKYGRFSQWMARLVGTAIGQQGIPVVGPLLGAMGGDLFVKMLQSNAFGGPLQREILKHIGEDRHLLNKLSSELSEAQLNLLKKEIQTALRLPAPKEGLPQVSNNVPINLGPRTQSTIDNLERSNFKIRQPENNSMVGVKSIPKELEPLAQEARKYKSAEEFVKAQTNAYHGTPGKEFDEFKLGVGRNTENETNGLGVWVTPQPEAAKIFSNKIEQGLFSGSTLKDVGGTVMPVSTQLKNPKIYTATKGMESILDDIKKLEAERPSLSRASFTSDPVERRELFDKRDEINKKIDQLRRQYRRDAFEVFMDDRDQFAEYIEKGKKWDDRYVANNIPETNKKFIDYLRKQGHDGIIIKGTAYDAKSAGLETIDQVVVFDPKQVMTRKQLTDFYNKVKGKK